MITISLDVDEITDVAYQNLSPENKLRLNEDICAMVKNTINTVRATRLKKLFDEIQRDGMAGGADLSAELLSELLRHED